MNKLIPLLLSFMMILLGCGREDLDTEIDTDTDLRGQPMSTQGEPVIQTQEQVEHVSSEPVYINDKKLDPPPSPVSRLRTNFYGRQKQFAPMINRISRQYGVDPFLTHAIISQESWYRPTVGSPAGAIGLMQLIPEAGRRFGCTNRNNPPCNVKAGVKYLKFLAKKFEGQGNLQTIAAGYNAGEAVAHSYLNGYPLKGKNPRGRKTANGVPVASFSYNTNQRSMCSGVNVLPGYKCEGETYQYARNVAGYYLRYKRNPSIVGLASSNPRNPSSRATARGRI